MRMRNVITYVYDGSWISLSKAILIIVVLLAFLSITQVSLAAGGDPILQWNYTYGGPGEDRGMSVQQTSDGGYIVAGYTNSNGNGYQAYLVKTNPSGIEQWHKTYGGVNFDNGMSVQQTSDGGYIVAGYTNSNGNGYQVYLVKTNPSGIEQWHKTYGGSGNDYGRSVQQTSDGGYIITGQTTSFGNDYQVYLVKTDPAGVKQWEKTYGGDGFDSGASVQQTSDGGYIITGQTTSFGNGYQVYLVKTDKDGIEEWNTTYGESGEDGGTSVRQTSDGGYIVAGYKYTSDKDYQVYLVKVGGGGNSDNDNIPPVTSLSMSGTQGESGWYISNVTVTLSAADSGSGVSRIEYSLDNAVWNTYPTPFTISSEGNTTIYYRSIDNAGNIELAKTQVIKIDKTPPVLGIINAPADPKQAGSEISFNNTIKDNVSGLANVTWDWGDGITFVASMDSDQVTGTHVYAAPGIYTVTLSATDKAGNQASIKFDNMIIYDPNGGFITGGGWVNLPAGAYLADSTLKGKANFGFVSKYDKGKAVPTGNTEFQFKIGDLNFKSTAYEWLVISGAKAQYKGSGTINGAGDYGFIVTAIDGEKKSPVQPDTFMIKIWDKATNALIFDSLLNASDDADPTTTLGGGSIVIHKEV
jgi:PKD repeat protein